jgi:uncharacterized membrane protein
MNNKTYRVFYKDKKSIFRLLLLALTAFYCILPLVVYHGLPYVDDMVFHFFQADQFNQALKDGIIYPRWIPDSNNGYGSPNFVFYSPLSYYLVSITTLFTHSLTTAMIIVTWCSFFFSGTTMFITTRKMFGGTGSPLPAIIYQILPFHLGDLYVRGTFAELVAFIWFPLVFYFIHEILKSRNKMAFIGLSISYAGLILTHLVSGFIFTLVIGAYLIYNYFLLKDRKPIIDALFSMVLGLGMSAVYLLPVIFERRFVQIDYLVNCDICDYKNNFLFTFDKFQAGLRSFYLPLHIEVVLEVILSISIILLIRKSGQRLSNTSQQKFFIFLFIVAFLLTTPLSKPIWNIVPGFPFLQFPWRWVMVMELSLCLLIGAIFSLKEVSGLGLTTLKKRVVVYLIITLSLVSLNMILKGSHLISRITVATVDVREYTPIRAGDMKKIISETGIQKASVVSGRALIDIVEWKSENRVISVEASEPSILRISTFYFPGWEAYIDNNRSRIKIENESGAMLVDIPKGKHKLVLKFEDTPIRYYAKIISLVSFCVMVLLVLFSKKSNRNLTSPI